MKLFPHVYFSSPVKAFYICLCIQVIVAPFKQIKTDSQNFSLLLTAVSCGMRQQMEFDK